MNPYIHVILAKGQELSGSRTLEVFEGEVDARALREAKDWAEANYVRLWDAWREFNP